MCRGRQAAEIETVGADFGTSRRCPTRPNTSSRPRANRQQSSHGSEYTCSRCTGGLEDDGGDAKHGEQQHRDAGPQQPSRNRWGFAGGTVLAACVWSRANRAPLRGLTLWRPTRRRQRGRCGHLRIPRKQENAAAGWPFFTPVHPPAGAVVSVRWVKHLPGKPRVCCLWPAAPRAGFRPMGTTPGRRRSRRRRPRFCVAVLPTSGSRRAARSRARPRRGGPSGTRWAGARRGRGWARPRGAARRASGRGSGRPGPR